MNRSAELGFKASQNYKHKPEPSPEVEEDLFLMVSHFNEPKVVFEGGNKAVAFVR